MKYYKIIKDNNFIGVCSSTDFIKYQTRNHCYISCDELHGEYAECKGKLYRDTWMPPVSNESNKLFEQALILEITEEEYNTYIEAIQHNEEIIYNDIDWQEPIIIDDNSVDITSIEFIRQSKLNEMSYTCRTTIEQGFDFYTQDDEICHFSLTTQDQLNLMSLSALADTQEYIPYHADGEASKFYTAQEIKQIAAEAASFKNYHLAYYNSLKAYINSLETIEDIAAITYGISIPDNYKTDVLKLLEQ